MPEQIMPAFWKALEALPQCAAPIAEWRRILGAEFTLAKKWLRPQGDLAPAILTPRGEARVVADGSGQFIAICEATGRAISVVREELVIWEVDLRGLMKSVCAALDFRENGNPFAGVGSSELVGWHTLREADLPVVFLRISRLLDIERGLLELNATYSGEMLLLTPTNRWKSNELLRAAQFQKMTWWALEDRLVATDRGTLRARSLDVSSSTVCPTANLEALLRRRGDGWEIRFGGAQAWLEPSQGAEYLARLLRTPGRSWLAAEIWGEVANIDSKVAAGTRGPAADSEAIQAYKVRLAELEEELETARELGSASREETIAGEISKILEHLQGVSGLAGRPRDLSDRERARKRVGNALRRLLEKFESIHPALARHLGRSLRLGSRLIYEPEGNVRWEVKLECEVLRAT